MIKPLEDAEEAAKRLMQEAYQRGSADNITCVVVRFLMNQGSSSHTNSVINRPQLEGLCIGQVVDIQTYETQGKKSGYIGN